MALGAKEDMGDWDLGTLAWFGWEGIWYLVDDGLLELSLRDREGEKERARGVDVCAYAYSVCVCFCVHVYLAVYVCFCMFLCGVCCTLFCAMKSCQFAVSYQYP